MNCEWMEPTLSHLAKINRIELLPIIFSLSPTKVIACKNKQNKLFLN